MTQTPANLLPAHMAARAIASGELTSEALVRACLERIAEREPVVQAWAHLDAASAIDEARQRDNQPNQGPLHGVPVAIKDIIDVRGMPCRMGSPIHENNMPAVDAACVALMRAAGAVILGKTVTAEFAGTTPGPTANPLDLSRTPGGSSSGSAAAVADAMAPVALGTQTGGSVLRPAAFCGVIGFNPGFGAVNRAGIKFAAESLDTIGVIARDLEDIVLFWGVLTGGANLAPVSRTPKISISPGPPWARAAPESADALDATADRFAARGAEMTPFKLPADIPDDITELRRARVRINGYERARALAWEWHHHRDLISASFRETLAAGWALPCEDYVDAMTIAEKWRGWLDEAMQGIDAILTPTADGEADEGLGSTGDPAFQELWTLLHAPAITLPLHKGPTGLPVGIQLVGRRRRDAALLQVAAWAMAASAAGAAGAASAA